MNAQAAHQLGLHIGSRVRLGFNSDAQLLSSDCCSAKATPPVVVVDLRLVGIIVLAPTVVQDDVDALGSQVGLFTPALTRKLAHAAPRIRRVRCRSVVAHGTARRAVGDRSARRKPRHSCRGQFRRRWAGLAIATAERAIRPEAIALGVFGGIAALAAILIAAQVIGRQLRLGEDDAGAIRALGAGPVDRPDGLVGVLGAVVLGSLLAFAVAVALSPTRPSGPFVRCTRHRE